MADTETQGKRSGQRKRKATVKHRAFPYRVEIPHPYEPDNTMINDRVALRGDEIEVLPHDYERGLRLGSFLEEGETMEDVTEPRISTFSAVDATDTELITWIKEEEPSAQQIVDASDGDPETAQRLLAAESAATGNDPRRAVVTGLEEVVRRSAE